MASPGPDKEAQLSPRAQSSPGALAELTGHTEPGVELGTADTETPNGATNSQYDNFNTPSLPCDNSLYTTAVEANTCDTSLPTSKNKVPLSLYKTSDPASSHAMQGVSRGSASLDDSAAVLSLDINTGLPPNCASTPVKSTSNRKHTPSTCDYDVAHDQVRFTASCKAGESSDDSLAGSAGDLVDREDRSLIRRRIMSAPKYEMLDPGDIAVPIRGYEIMEQRARFTVFTVQVFRSSHDSWYVFRRYTDFVQLNDKLAVLFPGFRLALPPKKWFGDNFDPEFLEDRMLGLQAFINNITGHKDVCNSQPVREFFCFDDPPGPHDSLEESRALCEALEEQLYNTRKELRDRESTISVLTEERDMYRSQVKSLQTSLRVQRTLNSHAGLGGEVSPRSSDASLAECDQPTDSKTDAHTNRKDFCDDELNRCRSPESGIGEGIVTTPSEEGTKGIPSLS